MVVGIDGQWWQKEWRPSQEWSLKLDIYHHYIVSRNLLSNRQRYWHFIPVILCFAYCCFARPSPFLQLFVTGSVTAGGFLIKQHTSLPCHPRLYLYVLSSINMSSISVLKKCFDYIILNEKFGWIQTACQILFLV